MDDGHEQLPLPGGPSELEHVERSFRLVAQGLDSDVKELRALVFELHEKVQDMEPHPLSPDGQPMAWSDRAESEDWAKLGQWVDWLILKYEVQTGTIAPCWPLHDGFANDLASLWMDWAAATTGPPESDAMLVWHDRWLPAALERYRLASSRCGTKTGHAERMLGAETDIDALRHRMFGGSETPAGAAVDQP